MKYDPDKYHRWSLRLKDHDYARAGAYFVTICSYQRECLFGEVVNGVMRCNEWGEIVRECWYALPQHLLNAGTDAFAVMPNHVHGIVLIEDPMVGAQHAAPLHAPLQHTNAKRQLRQNVAPGSLGAIIRSFKSATTKRINALRDAPGAPVWQRNYHERVIRSEDELDHVRSYIEKNPLNWAQDRGNPALGGTIGRRENFPSH